MSQVYTVQLIAQDVKVIGKSGLIEVTVTLTADEIERIYRKVTEEWQPQASITQTP